MVIVLLLILIGLIQLPSVQNYLTQKSINYLEDKVQTEVKLEKIYIGFPKSIVLEGLYVEDQQQDTLLDLKYLSVDMEMWALWNNNVEINSLTVDGLNGNIYTLPDSQFNYQFIIDAFAGNEETSNSKPKTQNSSAFTIEDVQLNDINLNYDDALNGMQMYLNAGQLELGFDHFKPAKNRFHANQLRISDTEFDFVQSASGKTVSKDGSAEPIPFDIAAETIILENLSGHYNSVPHRQKVSYDLGYLHIYPETIKLNEQLVALDEINIRESEIKYQQDSIPPSLNSTEKRDTVEADTPSSKWKVRAQSLIAAHSAFSYQNNNHKKQKTGIDYNHMDWNEINFSINQLQFAYPDIQAIIESFSAQESSGFKVDQLRTNFDMGRTGLSLQDFQFRSPHSDLSLSGSSNYSSIESIINNIESLGIQVEISRSKIGFSDILYLQSNLEDVYLFDQNKVQSIGIKGAVSGQVSDLEFNNIQAYYGSNTRMRINGSINGLPNIDTTIFNIEIPLLRTNKREISELLPASAIPDDIRLPNQISAIGHFKGTISDFKSGIQLKSTYGKVVASGELKPGEGEKYQAEITMEQFNLGEMLGDTTSFGNTTLQVSVDGQEFNWENLKADITASVDSFDFNQYTYRNIEFNSNIAQKRIELEGNIKDSNLIADVHVKANMGAELVETEGRLNIQGINLEALHLVNKDIRTKGILQFNVTGLDPDSLKGQLSISDILVIKEGTQYLLDSMYASANTMDTISRLDLHSDFVKGFVEGNVDPMKFANVFQHHLNHYLDTRPVDSLASHAYEQQFDFEFNFEQSVFLSDVLLPALERMEPAHISGKYNSDKHVMQLDGDFPHIVYNGIRIDSLDIGLNSDPKGMQFSISSKRIANPLIQIDNPKLSGEIRDNKLDLALGIMEDTAFQNLYLAGQLKQLDSIYRFEFDRKGVVFDNKHWSITEDHYLQFGPGGIDAQNVHISRKTQSVSIVEGENKAVEIQFDNFSLQDISQAFKKEQEIITGIMNGKLKVLQQKENPVYLADLSIKDLQFLESPIGHLDIKAQNKGQNLVSLNAAISGNQNDIQIKGTYDLEDAENALDFKIDMNRLNMKSLEAFTVGRLQNMTGYAEGKIQVIGPPLQPKLNGQLRFINAGLEVSALHTHYRIDQQKILFNRDQVGFNNFTILDTTGNTASLNGSVSIEDFRNPEFQLDAQTDNFLVLDKPDQRDALFFGKLILDSDVEVRGSLFKPKITATANVVESSDVAWVIPGDDPRLEKEGGIDEFIDRDQELSPIMKIDETKDTVTSEIKGLDIRANLSIDRNSEIKIFLDQGRGNYLKVKGDADLIVGIDPGGQITLTGRYEIYDGEYQLLFRNVVKRSFDLSQGSSIVWTGDPLEARVNLNAIHVKEAEPLGLLQDQLSDQNQAAINRFKQNLPFQVELNMKDRLTSPEIDFDISLPQAQQGALGGQVQAKLNQLNQNESAVNKQVFALLVLGRFIPEDPFNVSGGSSAEAAARRSVSKLLNSQIDKFSERYIDAFDLDLSLESYEDYSTGEAEGRTELNIGINKAFFNERLTVSVGGNVDLEGERSNKQQAADFIGDISVEYALTEDGSWKLRAFRKNEYEGIIDGDIIKTGASLIFSKDYNTISEIFGNSKKQKN